MNNVEMNKFMLWLIGAFPAWKPDKGVAAVWAAELPDITANVAMASVRAAQSLEAKPFPPGVFEICATLKGRCDPHREALMLFSHFWYGKSDPGTELLSTSLRAQRAFNLACGGNGYGQALTENHDWHEKRFCEIYEGLVEREIMPQLASSEIKTLLLEAPKGRTEDEGKRIAEAKEKVIATLLKLYPSGQIPNCDIGKVKDFISAQLKCDPIEEKGLVPIGETIGTYDILGRAR